MNNETRGQIYGLTPSMIKNIGVIGVGGVGGYFGAKLCQLPNGDSGVKVGFIARGRHLETIQAEGLLLKAEGEPDLRCKPSSASNRIGDLGNLGLCLICVKQFDLEQVLGDLSRVVTEQTVIVPLLNGVDSHRKIRHVVSKGFVLPACVYIGTHIEKPGVVSQSGGACKILFGPDPAFPDFDPTGVTQVFAAAGIKCEWKPQIQSDIWEKFIFICGYGLVTATYNKTLGDVLGDDSLKGELVSVMSEATALARGLGVSLPEQIVAASVARGTSFPAETKTSFQRDFEVMQKPDERELFAGSMLEIGAQLGIDIPRTRELYRILNKRKPIFWK